jgi:putative tricarboxylic transport membrane protein
MLPMLTMKRPYQITASILFFLSALITYESLQLKYYTPLGPGPGFFPFWLSLCLAVLSLVMFYQATFKKSDPWPEDLTTSRLGYLRALGICVAWIWAAAMLERLGYRLTMLVFFPFLLLTLGRAKWYIVVLVTLLGSIVTFYVFSILLSAPLPVGPLDGIFEPIDNLLY